jgi:hypothetical protein
MPSSTVPRPTAARPSASTVGSALFGGRSDIREFIAFPKNNAGRDVMIDAPSPWIDDQLKELGIVVKGLSTRHQALEDRLQGCIWSRIRCAELLRFALALSMRCSVSGWLLRKASCSGMSMASRSNSSRSFTMAMGSTPFASNRS